MKAELERLKGELQKQLATNAAANERLAEECGERMSAAKTEIGKLDADIIAKNKARAGLETELRRMEREKSAFSAEVRRLQGEEKNALSPSRGF